MKCKLCKKTITIALADDGTTQGEWDYQEGHKNDCILYKVADDTISINHAIEMSKRPTIMPIMDEETRILNEEFDRQTWDYSMYLNE